MLLYILGHLWNDLTAFVSFMFSLSAFYEKFVPSYLRQNSGKVITIHKLGRLFGEAYNKATTIQNYMSGFLKTGIFPLRKNHTWF